MNIIETLKQQHEEILSVADKLNKHILNKQYPKNSAEIVDLLMDLAGILKVHLTLEDKVLYPNLLKNSDASISEKAELFTQEMGDFSETFKHFIAKWANEDSIIAAPNVFLTNAKPVLNTLIRRIVKENSELFPILILNKNSDDD